MANSYFNENTLEELIEEIKYVYKSDDRPWVIGYSGGKDSTTVVELVYKMLLGLFADCLQRKLLHFNVLKTKRKGGALCQ